MSYAARIVSRQGRIDGKTRRRLLTLDAIARNTDRSGDFTITAQRSVRGVLTVTDPRGCPMPSLRRTAFRALAHRGLIEKRGMLSCREHWSISGEGWDALARFRGEGKQEG